MTEKEYKAKLTQAHTEGYNRGYAKAKRDLEARIEKMKCCSNCKHFNK